MRPGITMPSPEATKKTTKMPPNVGAMGRAYSWREIILLSEHSLLQKTFPLNAGAEAGSSIFQRFPCSVAKHLRRSF